uniref:Uncharacterized protein n=1 Tax=viral metagenome TaxID=1070528 RepID=A0A6M3XAB3_9ZZZZ
MFSRAHRHVVNARFPEVIHVDASVRIAQDTLGAVALSMPAFPAVASTSTSDSTEIAFYGDGRNETIYLSPSAPTTVISVSGTVEGYVKTIVAGNGNLTIRRNSDILLNQPTANPDFAMAENDVLKLLCIADGKVQEITRVIALA